MPEIPRSIPGRTEKCFRTLVDPLGRQWQTKKYPCQEQLLLYLLFTYNKNTRWRSTIMLHSSRFVLPLRTPKDARKSRDTSALVMFTRCVPLGGEKCLVAQSGDRIANVSTKF